MLHVTANLGTTRMKWSASTRYVASLEADSPSVGLLSYTSDMSLLRMSSCLPQAAIRSCHHTAGNSSRKALTEGQQSAAETGGAIKPWLVAPLKSFQ